MGYVKLNRSEITEDLLAKAPNAFRLLTFIALRARRSGCSLRSLESGQALIGDAARMGLTQREYRTSKAVLEKTGLATFQATNKGTIATIVTSDVYDINQEQSDKQEDNQSDKQATSRRQTKDKQATTNKNERKKEVEEGAAPAAAVAPPKRKASKFGPEEVTNGLDHSQLIEVWHDLFKAQFGTPYSMVGGRDGKAVKSLLRHGSVDDVMGVATRAWALTGFLGQRASTMHGLESAWNEINAELKRKDENGKNGNSSRPRNSAMHQPDYDPHKYDGIG